MTSLQKVVQRPPPGHELPSPDDIAPAPADIAAYPRCRPMDTTRSTRRSTGEVRELIVGAAAAEFAVRGFGSTTMRAVSDAAGISPSVLHRHFPTKDRLFAATALSPFLGFFEQFAASWREQLEAPLSEEELMGELISGLFHHLTAHRLTLIRLVSLPDSGDDELLATMRTGLTQIVTSMLPIGEHEAQVRGWFSPDVVGRAVALTLTLVSGLVLMRPWLEIEADDDQLVRTTTLYALHGIRQSPDPAR